jgi:hypothetical protein
MANSLTSITLHVGQERSASLVGASKVTPVWAACTAATWTVAMPVESASVKAATITHSRRTIFGTSGRSPGVALFDAKDLGAVPLDVAVGYFVRVH